MVRTGRPPYPHEGGVAESKELQANARYGSCLVLDAGATASSLNALQLRHTTLAPPPHSFSSAAAMHARKDS